MEKAPVDGETNPVETGEEAERTWWEVSVGENGRYRLPDDYVRSILELKRTPPHEEVAFLKSPNLAQLLGVTEESLEKDRQLFYGEEAARSKRINDNLVLFQNRIREEWARQGYVEVGEEYITNIVKMQEFSDKLQKQRDRSDFPWANPDDPAFASWYEHCSEEEIAEYRCMRTTE